nr:immunoglobulin heavy chain junction region [Macaca mulatta]MOV87889.1 immunoglobulin heavy chain junction region [Macaca mulatta]MOV88689.1 immunoglobulin heavy chain junction region [Macaca mulatta]MOV88873.1 immunoglobulin heavy chain junction region [Macaca mulatta]MOV90674.1 immunoglobulin heavy chain junction region [Macaca mulatta]
CVRGDPELSYTLDSW